MKYFKIKPEYDQHWRNNKPGEILIANELYTENEAARYNIKPYMYNVIEIPKSKIYWMFGARFQATT